MVRRKQGSDGAWGMLLGTLARVLRIVLLSMLVAPLLAIALATIQPTSAIGKAELRLNEEAGIMDDALRTHLLFQSRDTPARNTTIWIDRILKGVVSGLPFVSLRAGHINASRRDLSLLDARSGLLISRTVVAASTALQNWAVRLLALAGAMPLFVVTAMLGVADGLVRRDIRRWSAGRESAFVYHFAKAMLLPAVGWASAVILCAPFAVNVHLWIWGSAFCLGVGVTLMASRFRKYL